MRILLLFSSIIAAANGSPSMRVKKALLEAIKKEIPKEVSVEIDNVSLKELPPNSEVHVLQPHPPLGLISFEVDVNRHGERSRVYGTAQVRGRATVAVAKQPIAFGEMLTAENVAFEPRDITPYAISGYFLQASRILEREASSHIMPGTVLGLGNSRSQLLVRNGKDVDLVYSTTGLRLITRVRALENGGISDWVRVENLRSHKILLAKVVGNGELAIK